MMSTTRAPPPFNPGYNPVYPGGAGYDPMYPGQRPPTGYNNVPHYNMSRPGGSLHTGIKLKKIDFTKIHPPTNV